MPFYLVETYNPENVSYYNSLSPDELQIFKFMNKLGKCFVVTERKEGTSYRIRVSLGVKVLYSGLENGSFTRKGLSMITGIDEKYFFHNLKSTLYGDEIIKKILDVMEPRDTLIRINDDHWKITRKYDSGKKKWAEFMIGDLADDSSMYSITINYGRNTRSFYPAKKYPANFPYKILKDRLKAPTSKKLF